MLKVSVLRSILADEIAEVIVPDGIVHVSAENIFGVGSRCLWFIFAGEHLHCFRENRIRLVSWRSIIGQ